MNGRAQTLELRDNAGLIAARRLIASTLLALLLLSATASLVRADTNNPFPGTQNDFTNQCRALGGTPHREATHVVSCTWPNGGKQTCDFNQKPNSCTYTPPPKNSPSPGGNAPTGNIEPAEQVTSADADQPGGALTESSQVVNADDSEVALAQNASAGSDGASTQVAQGNISTLPDIEEEGN